MKEEFNQANQDALVQIIKYLDEHCDGLRPQLVTITSWFSLHELVHCGGESDNKLIRNADLVQDNWCNDDCTKIIGFNDDIQGREALDVLEGWIGLEYPVWTLGEDGQYTELERDTSPYLIDANNPDEVKAFVSDFLARHHQ